MKWSARYVSPFRGPPLPPLTGTTQPRDKTSTSDDIIHIAALLRQKLPGDLVSIILDQAECWTIVAAAHRNVFLSIISTRELDTGLLLLTCTVPPGMPPKTVRKITLTVRSAGKCFEPCNGIQWKGGVRKKSKVADVPADFREEQSVMSLKEGQSPNPPSPAAASLFFETAQRDEILRWTTNSVFPLLEDRWFTDTAIWTRDHDDDKIAQSVRQLNAGDSIELSCFASHEDCITTIDSIFIEVECVYIRRL